MNAERDVRLARHEWFIRNMNTFRSVFRIPGSSKTRISAKNSAKILKMAQRRDVIDFQWFIVDTDVGLMLKMFDSTTKQYVRCGYLQNCVYSNEPRDAGVLKMAFDHGTEGKRGFFFAMNYDFEARKETDNKEYENEKNFVLWAKLDGFCSLKKWADMADVINAHLREHYAQVNTCIFCSSIRRRAGRSNDRILRMRSFERPT